MPVAQATSLTNDALREAEARLLAEREDLPAGSVLRCFCRAVRATILTGCPPPQVVAEAERLTQELLARRPSGAQARRGSRQVAGARVPPPRRAS